MHALLDQICMRICMRTDVLYIYIYSGKHIQVHSQISNQDQMKPFFNSSYLINLYSLRHVRPRLNLKHASTVSRSDLRRRCIESLPKM